MQIYRYENYEINLLIFCKVNEMKLINLYKIKFQYKKPIFKFIIQFSFF